MKNRITATITAIALAFTLTACGVTETTEPEVSTPVPTETVTPTVEPATPPAEEFAGEVAERNSDGQIVFPDGTVADCPAESTGAFQSEDGTVTCDAGVDW